MFCYCYVGHFIEEHLCEDYKGGWLHVDMAGPATRDQRATGIYF